MGVETLRWMIEEEKGGGFGPSLFAYASSVLSSSCSSPDATLLLSLARSSSVSSCSSAQPWHPDLLIHVLALVHDFTCDAV